MGKEFEGKRILVTGGGRGLGRCFVQALHEAGAEVYVISRGPESLKTLSEECPGIKTFAQDVSKWNEVKELVASMPPMDGLVNNAGVTSQQRLMDLTEDSFDAVMNTNLKAAINVAQSVVAKMVEAGKKGSIVNVSSQAAIRGHDCHLSYGASKAALDMVTKVMALELGPQHIRTNSVNPTVVLTELGRSVWSGERGEAMKNKIPLRKFAECEDVTNAVLFLLSEKSAMINGIIMPVDGGYSAA